MSRRPKQAFTDDDVVEAMPNFDDVFSDLPLIPPKGADVSSKNNLGHGSTSSAPLASASSGNFTSISSGVGIDLSRTSPIHFASETIPGVASSSPIAPIKPVPKRGGGGNQENPAKPAKSGASSQSGNGQKRNESVSSKILMDISVKSVGEREFTLSYKPVYVKIIPTGVLSKEEANILQIYYGAVDVVFVADGNKYAFYGPTRHLSELIKLSPAPWTHRLFSDEDDTHKDGRDCCFWVVDKAGNIHYGSGGKYNSCHSSNPVKFYDFAKNTGGIICTNSFSDYKLQQIDFKFREAGTSGTSSAGSAGATSGTGGTGTRSKYCEFPKEVETLDIFKILENCRPAFSLLTAKHAFASFFDCSSKSGPNSASKVKRPNSWENDYLCSSDADPSKRLEIIEAIYLKLSKEILPYTQSIGLTVKEALETDISEAVCFHENWMTEIRGSWSLIPYESGEWQKHNEILREEEGGSTLGIYELVEYAGSFHYPGSSNLPVHVKVKLLAKELSAEIAKNRRGDAIYYIGHGCILGNLSNDRSAAIMTAKYFNIYCPNRGFVAKSSRSSTHFAAGPVAEFYLTCEIAMNTLHMRTENDSEGSGDERDQIREYKIFITPDNYIHYLGILTDQEKMKFNRDRCENPFTITAYHTGKIFTRERDEGSIYCPFTE
jgi:hypothetical protein